MATNYERITESPEKLVEFLTKVTDCCCNEACGSCSLCEVCGDGIQRYREWLQEECE